MMKNKPHVNSTELLEQKHIDTNDLNFLKDKKKIITLDDIKKANSEQFQRFFLDFIIDPMPYLNVYPNCTRLGETKLEECTCGGSASHNRAFKNNTRLIAQELVLNSEAVSKLKVEGSIKVLSLGPGGLFQDVINIGGLIHRGYKSIYIELRDCEKVDNDVWQAFETIIEKINQNVDNFSDVSIIYHHSHNSGNKVPDHKFDLIYAFDYDDFLPANDYLRRDEKWGFFRKLGDEQYNTTMALIKAMTQLAPADTATFIMSRHRTIYTFTPSSVTNYYCGEAKAYIDKNVSLKSQMPYQWQDQRIEDISTLLDRSNEQNDEQSNNRLSFFSGIGKGRRPLALNSFQYFYLNTNIGHLIGNLDSLKKSSGTLLINEQIVLKRDRSFVMKLLNRYDIKFQFVASDSKAVAILQNTHKKCLILDYNSMHSETNIKNYKNIKNLYIIQQTVDRESLSIFQHKGPCLVSRVQCCC